MQGGRFISHRVCDDNFLIFPLLCPDTPTLPRAVEDEVEERNGEGERKETKSFMPRAWPDQEKSLLSLLQRSKTEVAIFAGGKKSNANKGGWS